MLIPLGLFDTSDTSLLPHREFLLTWIESPCKPIDGQMRILLRISVVTPSIHRSILWTFHNHKLAVIAGTLVRH